MRFRASNVALFLHLKSVWPDWAIFKGFGNKFSFKSSPNIIKLFWKHITFSVKTSPGYDLATFSEFGYFSSNIWSHCLLFESRQSIMGFIIFFEHFSTNFIFSFWKDKNVWKRHNNKKTPILSKFLFQNLLQTSVTKAFVCKRYSETPTLTDIVVGFKTAISGTDCSTNLANKTVCFLPEMRDERFGKIRLLSSVMQHFMRWASNV